MTARVLTTALAGLLAWAGAARGPAGEKPPPRPRTKTAGELPAEGLAGVWPGRGNANDVAGNLHGRAGQGLRFTADRHGTPNGAFLFDGKGGVTIPDDPRLDTDDAFTISLWIRPKTLGGGKDGEAVLVGKWLSRSRWNGDYLLALTAERRIRLRVAHREQTFVHDEVTTKSAVAESIWSHVAATFDRGKMALYINGECVARRTAVGIRHTSRREYEHDDVTVGAAWDGGRGFRGAIHDVAIWSRALGEQGVRALCGLAPIDVPQIARVVEADRVTTASGDVLMGTVLDETYVVEAFFGRVRLPAARVTGLTRLAKDRPRMAITLTDGQTLLGTVSPPAVRLKLSGGQVVRVEMGKVRTCGFRIGRDKPADPVGSAPMLTLRTGERLALAEINAKLRLERPLGTLNLEPGVVLGVEQAGTGQRVQFANGSTLTGTLLPESFRAKLKFGPELTVRRGQFSRLAWPGKTVRAVGGYTVVLRNGDRLLGRVESGKLTLRTKYGDAMIEPHSVKLFRSDPKQPDRLIVRLWNGTVLRGRLVGSALTLAIDPGGPTVRLPTGEISSITPSATHLPEAIAQRVRRLVDQLGAASFRERKAAVEALVRMGPGIAPHLRNYAGSSDAEVRQRIREVLGKLGAGKTPAKPTPARPGARGEVIHWGVAK